LNSAMASYVLDLYGKMLAFSGREKLSSDACQLAAQLRQVVRDQWAGRWFRRAWLTPELGWVGEDRLWLEPQPWAILGGAAFPEQAAQLTQAIDELVRGGSPIRARLISQGVEKMMEPAGEGANGGVWHSINGTLVWALAQCDGAMAWEEWQKNTLAAHAEAYPDTWYGIWSGPDFYNSILSKYPGQTGFDERFASPNPPQGWFGLGVNWTDFPVMNMHPHAWPLYSACKLLGVEFTPAGVELSPCLPLDEYHFKTPLLGLEKTAAGYRGWYAPRVAGRWQVSLRLPGPELVRFSILEVNDQPQALKLVSEGTIIFSGESTAAQPLNWSLKKFP